MKCAYFENRSCDASCVAYIEINTIPECGRLYPELLKIRGGWCKPTSLENKKDD